MSVCLEAPEGPTALEEPPKTIDAAEQLIFKPQTIEEGHETVENDDEHEDAETVLVPEDPPQVPSKKCELCHDLSEKTKNTVDDLIDDVPIGTIIQRCLYPLVLKDQIPQFVCLKCCTVLENFNKFRKTCLERNNVQDSDFKADIRCKKRKLELNKELAAKRRKEKEDLELERQLAEMENGVPDSEITFEDYGEKTEVDTKVAEELRKVLEGQLSEEQIAAENIIIAVESDDDQITKASISEMKLPIVIKPLNRTKEVTKKLPKKEVAPKMVGKTILPKGISVKVANFVSDVGVYEAESKIYLFNTEFCLVDGYIYEYRLCKGNSRFLRCIVQNCHGLAVQEKLGHNNFSKVVTVKEPHNHQKPSEKEIKKQMLYHIMKRMMQNDKSMNIKSVYEEVCEIDPEIRSLVPLNKLINEICRHQLTNKTPIIESFDDFCEKIEEDAFKKLHFTHSGNQFYQEKFEGDDGSKAVVFANSNVIDVVSHSKLMYVDASFRIESTDDFNYQLVTILVWMDDSYYPILFALVNQKSQEIYKKILEYLRDSLAPQLRPQEIVTDYESNLYYALGETYLESHIGGSVFYYTQNLYKKICSLNLSRELETNSYFRNIYHMLLMLPLLPVNTILDGLNNIEIQAKDLGFDLLTEPLFDHIRTQWIEKVTPDLFCVHRLENRINENVIAPFKKLRDFLMLSKGKVAKNNSTIVRVVEKLIELESFLQVTYATPNKKSFARDLSSSQKKNVLKAWQFIESHPKININNFFTKVLGYIKCMENQLWIWGFYRFQEEMTDDLINASNFLIVANDLDIAQNKIVDQEGELVDTESSVVMEAVIDENGTFVLQNEQETDTTVEFDNNLLQYVYKE